MKDDWIEVGFTRVNYVSPYLDIEKGEVISGGLKFSPEGNVFVHITRDSRENTYHVDGYTFNTEDIIPDTYAWFEFTEFYSNSGQTLFSNIIREELEEVILCYMKHQGETK